MPESKTDLTTDTPPARTHDLPAVTLDAAADDGVPIRSEWVLANGVGGFAMGTPSGVNTRRYHGLLVASLSPPVERVVALSAVADTLTLAPGTPDEFEITLTPFHFRGAPDRPDAAPAPCRFTRTPSECAWTFALTGPAGPCVITKTLHMFDQRNAVALTYHADAAVPARLTLRPLTALRDFHHLVTGEEIARGYQARPVEGGVMCATRQAGVHLVCPGARYTGEPDIWHAVEYLNDQLRGEAHTEDLFSPGRFTIERSEPGVLEATLHASIDAMPPTPLEWDRTEKAGRLAAHIGFVRGRAGRNNTENTDCTDTDALARFVAAADDYVVRRGPVSDNMSSVIAGYPWFADWGRDTMIALPGLLLATGRHDEALRTLTVFAEHRRNGLIPNRFDDRPSEAQDPAHYNTVDAPLWFLHAAAEYRRLTGDHAGYMDHLARACADIIDAYRVGTDHHIRLDDDGLVTAGDTGTQLTWMDAQRAGLTFTPRHGKAVEINALWHRGLLVTADAFEDDSQRRAAELRKMAEHTAEAMRAEFVRGDGLGLYDRLEPPAESGGAWTPSPEIRPNQIFAVSMPGSPLTTEQQAETLAVVRDRLLTPHGLRTLDPADPGYVGRYEGTMLERDRAYHNGTAWPWLLGPYAEAVLRVGLFSEESRREARACLRPLLDRMAGPGLGQIAEVYDGDGTPEAPQRPDGCAAQAWSVAEPLRILTMLHERA